LKSLPSWLWPASILFSIAATALVVFVAQDFILRPIIVMWFLFICPGKAFIPLLRIKDAASEWMLTIGLSIALDAIIAALQLYNNLWSPSITFLILMFVTLCGLALQLLQYALR